jgi:biopolymer transport protein ExbD
MLLTSAALLIAMQTMPEYAVVVVSEGRKGCEYRAEGRRLTETQLEHRARVWAGQGRKVEVQGERNIAYRCVGSVMFILQSAGVEKFSYVGKPIRPGVVLLGTAPKGCAPMVNGEAMTMEQFRVEAARWRRDQPEIHFQPDMNTDYRCVDAVLSVIKENQLTKLGFVGNEQYRAQ